MELLNHHRRHHPTAKAKVKQPRENKPQSSKIVVENSSDFKTDLFASTSATTTSIITRPPKPRSSSLEPLNLRDTTNIMNSSSHHQHHHHHPSHHHEHHHDVHQQRLLWFFSFCNQRSSSSSSSSSGSGSARRSSSRRKSASSRNKFAMQYQQQLQQQQRQSSNVFGRDLIEQAQLFGGDDVIPYIVKSCTKFIEKHGIIFGIYRLSGMRVNIHKLRQDFDKNPKISMIDNETISNDAHAVACVLKQYFRELPTPLLTFHMYEKFIELFKHSNTTNLGSELDDSNIIDTIDGEQNDVEQHDNNNMASSCMLANKSEATKATETTPNKSTLPSTMAIKSKSSAMQPTAITTTAAIVSQKQKQTQFTSSASDSQLISLSSVVTTTTSDIKYQVKLGELKRLLLQLPKAHYQTLKFLMRHLACIAANGKKTGMDSKNVAIVWAPNLLKPRNLELSAGLETLQVIGLQAVITEQLIKHHKFLFDDIDTINESGVDQAIDNVKDEDDDVASAEVDADEGTTSFGDEIIEESGMATNITATNINPDNDDDTENQIDDDKIVDDKSVENSHNLQECLPKLVQTNEPMMHKDQEQLKTATTTAMTLIPTETSLNDINKQDKERDKDGENKL